MARPATSFASKAVVPGNGASLYLLEFSDGVVKVGFSSNARWRIEKVCYLAGRYLGVSPTRVRVFRHQLFNAPGQGREACRSARCLEHRLIHAAIREGAKPVLGREYLSGITLDAVERLFHQVPESQQFVEA